MSTPSSQVAGYVVTKPPTNPRATNFDNMQFLPGVASNSTSRDLTGRWVQSNRVRWHKQLAEKIGGWTYVNLTNNSSQTIPSTSPVLLLHFDGNNGDTSTLDSSLYNNQITLNEPNASISTAQTSPVGDTTVIQLDGRVNTNTPTGTLSSPVTSGSALDLSQLPAWTFEYFFYFGSANDGNSVLLWAGMGDFSSPQNGFLIIHPGTSTIEVFIYGETTGPGNQITGTCTPNAWHHIAIVKAPNTTNGAGGDQYQLFVDGVSQTISTGWHGPYAHWNGQFVLNGYFEGPSGYNSIINSQTGPYYYSEVRLSPTAVYTSNFTPPTAPFANPQFPTATYLGTVRAACDWASLDGQYWIAFATEQKLYLINNDYLYDITPQYQTSNLNNVLSTQSGLGEVIVTDVTNNKWQVGDWITILTPVTVGGIPLSGQYQITGAVAGSPYQYSITTAAATSTVTNGGGSVSISYDISAGLAFNGFEYGYGTGEYGEETYGTARPVGQGIPVKMRNWSLSNWGQDLVASYNGGSLYWWQWSTGPSTPAQLVTNAPNTIQRILVNADAQYLIAVGATDVNETPDFMNVRWCSEGDLTDWTPVTLPVANTAGGQRLNFGSRMVTGIQSRQQNLLWSDTQMYQMQSIGEPNIFGFNELGKCYIVGPNAAIDVNGVVYMMCFDDFMIYDGTLRVLPCDMWETVFGPTDETNPPITGFDRSQAEATYCASYMTKSEVTWFYPAYGSDVMNYITYNYEDGVWYGGTMPRTCYHDVSPALAGYIEYPYAFNGGYFYQHEIGYDEIEASGKNPMYWFLQSWDVTVQTDRPVLVNRIIPNWQRLRNGCQFSYLCKEYPQDSAYITYGPYIVTPDTTSVDERAGGAQVALKIEAASVGGQVVLGQDFRMGTWQILVTQHGKRIAGNTRGGNINTNNP